MRPTLGQQLQILLGKALAAMPLSAARALTAGRVVTNRAGMTLDPKARLLCLVSDWVQAPLDVAHVDFSRVQMVHMAQLMDTRTRRLEVEQDLELDIGEARLPARLFSQRKGKPPSPVLVFFHGGGFVKGGLDSHAAPCRRLAVAGGCSVLSVDYRLAPEHPFPTAVDDCAAAFRWVVERGHTLGLDPTRVAVGGDSAGANLSAAVCLAMRDRGGPHPALQLLYYPVTDTRFIERSHAEFNRGYLLDRASMDFFLDCYVPDLEQRKDPRIALILSDDLRALPEAVVFTAGFDPLRDEGKALAEALRLAGCKVTYSCYEDMIHGFINMAGALPQGARALEEGGAALRRVFEQHS